MPTDAELLAAALDPYQQQADPTLLAALANPAAPDVPRQSSYLAELGAAPTVRSTGGPVQAVTPVGQALAGGIADTLMAPGRAYNGQMAVRDPETGHMTQDATDWGAGTALGMLGGSSIPRAPIAGPGETAIGMFAGRTAKTADLGALSQAEKLAGSGAPREQIWNETGWFQGPDQQWRFEIPDQNAAVNNQRLDATGGVWNNTAPASEALNHSALFEAYPQLGDVDVSLRNLKPGMRGQMRMPTEGDAGGINLNASLDPFDRTSTMLHELQHAIQGVEGFGRGSNPAEYRFGQMFPDRARALQGDLSHELTNGITYPPSDIIRDIGYADPGRVAEVVKKHGFESTDDALKYLAEQDAMRTPVSQYRRTSGEVEARNVQARQMMSDERQTTPPWATQDVPDAQQIVRLVVPRT